MKILLAILTFIFNLTLCFPQDMIKKKSGEVIQAKILEVGLTEIKYMNFDDQSGQVFIVLKSDLLIVIYENGVIEKFNEENKVEFDYIPRLSNDGLFKKGKADAFEYYTGYKKAATGILIVSLLSPIVGLLPTIGCSITNPKKINLNYPNENLMKKSDYYDGYTQCAKKIKQKKVWINWGIAFGINFVLAYWLYS